MIYAAGILLVAPSGRVLLMKRSALGDHGGEWCCPGGKMEDGESAADAAVRETLEETGYRVGTAGEEIATRVAEDVNFTTFLKKIDEEFVPKLDDENVAFAWVSPKDALGDMPMMPPPTVPAPGMLQ